MARELEIVVTAEVASAVAQLNKVLQAVTSVEKGASDADKSVSGLETAMKTGGSSAGKLDGALGGMTGQFAKLAGLIGVGAVVSKGFDLLVGGIKAVGGTALEMNANLEKSTLQFTTLMGDSAKAEAHVRSLFDFAKRTPFETGPIITASKHLQLFGGDALNTQKNLQLLGDASAASGAQFEEVAFWTGRMYASLQAGKPVGEAMMRLMELGVVTPQARNGIEALAASAGGGTKAFELFQKSLGQFTGAMNLQANTWGGLTSTISDAVQITIADALEPFFDLMKTGAGIVAQVLGSAGLQKTFDQVAASIKAALGPNTAAQVKTLLLGFVSFGDGVVLVADVATRAFYGLKLAVQLVLQGIVEFFNAQVSLTANFIEMAASVPGVGRAFEGLNRSLQDQKLFMQGATDEARKQTAAAYEGVKGNSAFGTALDGSRKILDTLRVEISKATVTQNDATVAVTKTARAMDDLSASSATNAKEIAKQQKEWAKFEKDLSAFTSREFKQTPLSKIFEFSTDPMIQAQDELNKFQKSITSFSAAGSKAWTTFAATVEKEAVNTRASFTGLGTAFRGLPQTIIGALQGGGNALKSVGASLGAGLASDLASNLGSKLPGLFGSALSAAAGPLGSIVGSLAGSLVGKLFGPSQQKQVTDLRDKFLEAGGGLEAMRGRADAAGVSMDGLFNVRRPQDFDAAVRAFNQQLQDSEQRTNDTRAAMEKWGLTVADMGPKFATQEINGKLLSIIKDMELLTAAGADFNLVAEKMAPEINKLLAASMTAGTQVPRELEPIMRKMFDLGLLTDTNGEKLEDFGSITFASDINEQFERLIDKLDDVLDRWLGIEDTIDRSTQAVTDFRDETGLITPPSFLTSPGEVGGVVAQDMRAVGDSVAGVNKQLALSENHMRNVRSAMREWKLSLGDMGGTFAAQELNTQLQDILGDMELLTASGADFSTIAKAMGPSIGNLVVEAAKAGASVPQELEPLLRQMYDLGVFVDRQGKAISGLGTVQFSTTAQADFAALIARITQNLTGSDPFAVTGMDAGGVAGQTLRMPSSRDTIPALLRPGELVLTPEQQRAAGLGGGPTTVNVAINVAGYLDSPSARTGLAEVVRDELAKTLRRTGRAA